MNDDQNEKDFPASGITCKTHSPRKPKKQEGTIKGIISSYRNLDGLPIIEIEGGRVAIIKEFETKPEIGEEIEYILTAQHGVIMYGKRVE
ncbi:MAG: hypothetical protein ABIJ37_06710 [Pseudomonadota bacterium]